MLPFALYQACTLEGRMVDGYRWRDGSVQYLSPSDLRLCIDAGAKLSDEMASFVKVFTDEPSYDCQETCLCVESLDQIMHDVEMDVPGSLCSVLSSCERAIKDWAEQYELCAVCTREILALEVAERKRVWKLLPGLFGLTVEGCGFTVDDEPSDVEFSACNGMAKRLVRVR